MNYDELIIHKVFFHAKYWNYDEEKKEGEWRFKVLPFRNATNLLHYVPVALFHKITLRTVFKIIEYDPDFWEKATGEPVVALLEESKKEPKESCDLDYLEVGWGMDKDIWYPEVLKEKPIKSEEVTLYSYFHGIKKGEDIPRGIGFTGVNNIMDIPIKINPKLEIYITHYLPDGKYKHEEFTLGDKTFSMFEFIKEIFYELGWYGPPEKRDKTWESIQKSYKEAQNERES